MTLIRAASARKRRLAMDPATSPLLTDLYQLNMLQAYFDLGMTGTATFEIFCRKLPAERNFLMAAGLAQAAGWLQGLRFGDAELDWLVDSGRFSAAFIDHLAALRFEGDIDAMAEGSIFFPDEPILRLTAPLMQAQLVETRLLNVIHFQTLIASKAARLVLAAPGKAVIDFGLRRAHGSEAGLWAARAAYLAGCAGTATVLAAPAFGIPIFGTMAHAFIQAHDDETEAFRNFARCRPQSVVLLIDTYDTEAAAAKVVALAPELAAEGIAISGVRLDSGDLAAHARAVRAILDAGGLKSVQIFASGNLDEYRLTALMAGGAPIDGFGVGTSLVISTDSPALDCVYKLQAYAGRPRRKRSEGKATWPGAKQVYRRRDASGRMAGDTVALAEEPATGQPLLQPVIRHGRLVAPLPSLAQARRHATDQYATLPPDLAGIAAALPYPVAISPRLQALAASLDQQPAGS
jgi:nicotinate phosphoribosyltransferase